MGELINTYKRQGSELFYTLYHHPNTRDIFRKHINCADWGPFEYVFFDQVPEEKRLVLLEALGTQLDEMDCAKKWAWWKQLQDWQHIHHQLKLMGSYISSYTDSLGFIEFAFEDPTMRPAFQWILDSRPHLTNFNGEIVGSTISSAESGLVYPKLAHHLITLPEKERLECFARIFARLVQQTPTVFNDEVAN